MYYEGKRRGREGKDGYQLVEVVLRFNSIRLLSLAFCLHNRICRQWAMRSSAPSGMTRRAREADENALYYQRDERAEVVCAVGATSPITKLAQVRPRRDDCRHSRERE